MGEFVGAARDDVSGGNRSVGPPGQAKTRATTGSHGLDWTEAWAEYSSGFARFIRLVPGQRCISISVTRRLLVLPSLGRGIRAPSVIESDIACRPTPWVPVCRTERRPCHRHCRTLATHPNSIDWRRRAVAWGAVETGVGGAGTREARLESPARDY